MVVVRKPRGGDLLIENTTKPILYFLFFGGAER